MNIHKNWQTEVQLIYQLIHIFTAQHNSHTHKLKHYRSMDYLSLQKIFFIWDTSRCHNFLMTKTCIEGAS